MHFYLRPIFLICIISSYICACSAPRNPTPVFSSDNPIPAVPGYHLLVVADGTVFLKRQGWQKYFPASFGTALYRGDLLKPAMDSKAVVLCDNLETWNVSAGEPAGVTNVCSNPTEPVLIRGESRISNTRGGNDPSIPYILSPRSTKLSSSTPILKWNSVAGAEKYFVSITGREFDWRFETDQVSMEYPGDPPLQSGVTYLVKVQADNGSRSDAEGAPGLGFELLSPEEISQVNMKIERIKALGLTGKAEAFVIAQLYLGYGLRSEAIQILEEQIKQNNQEAAIYKMLGDIYRQVSLNLLAKESYLRAGEMANQSGDRPIYAQIHAGLAEVLLSLGQEEAAKSAFEQASDAYRELGDTATAEEMNNKALELTNP